MLQYRFVAAAAALVTATLVNAQTMTTTQRAEFAAQAESLAKAFLAESHAPSVSIAVVRGRDTLVVAAFGLASIHDRRVATPNTVYEIGSITKQFTAAAIMRLVEQKKISLDDDVSTYLPRIPLRGNRVTIRQLLNHTSGIHTYTAEADWKKHWAEDLTPDSLVGFVARDTFDFAPGTQYRYNNTGYVMLGMIIERVTKQPYAAYVQNDFLTPLGLRQTSYCPSHHTDPGFATGYSRTPDGLSATTYISMTQPFSAGALCSTPTDLVKWQTALDGGRVVSKASYLQMATPGMLKSGRRLDYGFGLLTGTYAGHAFVAHDGGINGFLSAAWFFPGDALSVIVLTNYDAAPPDALSKNLIRLAYGLPPAGSLRNPPPAR